jgi:hypothetical protein
MGGLRTGFNSRKTGAVVIEGWAEGERGKALRHTTIWRGGMRSLQRSEIPNSGDTCKSLGIR